MTARTNTDWAEPPRTWFAIVFETRFMLTNSAWLTLLIHLPEHVARKNPVLGPA